MIKFENIEVFNFNGALRGMRNALESWDQSDSNYCAFDDIDCNTCNLNNNGCHDSLRNYGSYIIGKNDLDLAQRLVKAGSSDSKFMRQIFISMDITAPLYWWKEFDTYKVATVANSTSTMHKLGSHDLTQDDFGFDFMNNHREDIINYLNNIIHKWREAKENKNKEQTEFYFRQMIQELPDSYLQKRTCTSNYQIERARYFDRRYHKQLEWRMYCQMDEHLPYGKELITLE